MDYKRNVPQGGLGRLPSSAPLATPYVPFQVENPPKYEPRTAIVRGTLFPGLDLPFMNMINQNELPMTPLTELQTMGFVLGELALYLDTHRDDKDALALYREYQKMYDKCRQLYAREHGPLTHGMTSEAESYSWLDDPWPWEYCGNKEA